MDAILPSPPPIELIGLPVETYALISAALSETALPTSRSPLHVFFHEYITSHPTSDSSTLLSTAPKRSTVYPPLLLLPSDAFTTPAWSTYLAAHPSLLPLLAAAHNVTHIARNAPIDAASTMRSPSRLVFLHPPVDVHTHTYTASDDFTSALWVTTTQHGIQQTWAPEHTMFSRGNIREKARVLSFPSVRGEEIADLYAGIGYFVLCYLRAGAKRVWCWEINPWSVEALRRGCKMNGWTCRVVKHGKEWVQAEDAGEEVVVFEESNEFAVQRMGGRRVKHVNLGLLPTSRGAWPVATELLEEGGCAHVHENVGEKQVEDMREGIVKDFKRMRGAEVKCEHVEKVKTFAPGVLHCVFDIRV
ncbi:S-adenosyl-L-methionine-dependent methyltransferase [Tricharina praecox]|uniref:S-adenosyl-L-methionine-dependent methyltransferase n=1 Tax=Tricharina praecox TaxID=43433 RepID=UPI00221E579C|nr:S-adenosyl-L-methionine-dependent methyltransferase [Tricharina praecox]KAI5843194.1 S-adenosyl-L-methionine-dependent methyltransferase [Tricharina praecox]